MTPTFAVTVAVAAGSVPVLALLGFDPAFASPLNFALLVYVVVFTHRERAEAVATARELARTAKGSEDRATRAAAEITRLAAEIARTREHVDKALVEVIVIGGVVRDRLAQLKVEHDLLADPDPREGVR